MITVDLSNIWGELSLPDLLHIEAEISQAHHGVCALGEPLPAGAGLPEAVLQYAREAEAEYHALRAFDNPVWLYAAVRCLMHRRGRGEELLLYGQEGFRPLGRWWQDAAPATVRQVSAGQQPSLGFETLVRFADLEGLPEARAEAGVPVVTIDCGRLNQRTLGELYAFFQISLAVSGRVLGR